MVYACSSGKKTLIKSKVYPNSLVMILAFIPLLYGAHRQPEPADLLSTEGKEVALKIRSRCTAIKPPSVANSPDGMRSSVEVASFPTEPWLRLLPGPAGGRIAHFSFMAFCP